MTKSLCRCCDLLRAVLDTAAALPALADDLARYRATEQAAAYLWRFLVRWETVKRRPTFKRWAAARPGLQEKHGDCAELVFKTRHFLLLAGDGFAPWRRVEREVLEGLDSAMNTALEFITLSKKKAGTKTDRQENIVIKF